jgi:hypothetical protein
MTHTTSPIVQITYIESNTMDILNVIIWSFLIYYAVSKLIKFINKKDL